MGGKTGYTDEASGNLVSIFSYGRRAVMVIVLGTSDRFGETEKLITWFKNAFSPSS
jgi:D-alanyl-D-alanine carboxypeptidase